MFLGKGLLLVHVGESARRGMGRGLVRVEFGHVVAGGDGSYHLGVAHLLALEGLAWRCLCKRSESHLMSIIVHVWLGTHHAESHRLLWISLALTVPFCLFLDWREQPLMVELLLGGTLIILIIVLMF